MRKISTSITPRKHHSVIPLIIANIFPIIGVYFFGWEIFEVVLLYIAETTIVGLYNVIKMMFTRGNAKFFLIPFFLFHYNFFILIQTIFIVIFFSVKTDDPVTDLSFLHDLSILFTKKDVLLSILLILLSHGYSLYFNYIKKKMYKKTDTGTLMFQPYKRIFVQQIVAIFGGIVLMLFNAPVVFLYLLVVCKTIIDMRAHIKVNRLREDERQ